MVTSNIVQIICKCYTITGFKTQIKIWGYFHPKTVLTVLAGAIKANKVFCQPQEVPDQQY
jgi:hypothetical protein